jgi:peptidoglycan/xylan/chitin deacetylase (PgdA/CDA1 family)
MDHDLYPFSEIVTRPPLRWPGGAPVALWSVLYLDYWELKEPKGAHRAPGVHGMWGSQFPDLRTYTYRLYGERIGVFRVLDVFKRHGIRTTVAAGAEVCRRYPSLISLCADLGHEIAAHGTHATRMITSRMTEAEERSFIADSVAAVERASSVQPRGWFGQDHGESERTPRLVAEAGLDYIADWPNDEQPYWMTTGRPLVSLPVQAELDDLQLLWIRQQPAWRYPELVQTAADTLARDGAAGGRTLGLGIRTWLFGRPHRIRYLDDALSRLRKMPGIWQATAGEIVTAFRGAVPEPKGTMT